MIRPLLALLTSLALLGCPPPPAPAADQPREVREALVLRARGVSAVPATLDAGGSLDLEVSTAPGEDDALFGALLADPQSHELTQWHVDPAGAATVDGDSLQATFHTAGDVKVWATWESPHGPVKSNVLAVQVAGAPAETPAGE